MDVLSGGMRTLSEDIIAGQKDREQRIRELKDQARTIRENAKEFLQESRRLHEKMGKDLQNGLQQNKENLVRNVSAMREDFRIKEREVRADLAEAGKIWSEMKNTLKGRRK